MSAAQASSVFAAEGTKYGKDPVAAYYALSETPWVTEIYGTANQISTSPTPGIGPDVTLALLPPSPAPTAGSYTKPTVTVDGLGRVTTIASNLDIVAQVPVPGALLTGGAAVTNIMNNCNLGGGQDVGFRCICSQGNLATPIVQWGGYGDGEYNNMFLIGLNSTGPYSAANARFINNQSIILTAGLVYEVTFKYKATMAHAAVIDNSTGGKGMAIYAVSAFGLTETAAAPIQNTLFAVCGGNAQDNYQQVGAYPSAYTITQSGTFQATIVGQGFPLRIGVVNAFTYTDQTDVNVPVWNEVYIDFTGQTGWAPFPLPTTSGIGPFVYNVKCLGPYVPNP